jgi:nicotinamide-nucleotide amidase
VIVVSRPTTDRLVRRHLTESDGGHSERLELICVGDELLDGRVADRNAHWLGGRLAREGRSLTRATFVSDAPGALVEALEQAVARVRRILVSGGLGPTEDDRVRRTVADWLGVPLEADSAALRRIQARFARLQRPCPPTNRRQAFFPRDSAVLQTAIGTADGFRVDLAGDRQITFVPGVPREFRWFVDHHWLPSLGPGGDTARAERTWKLFGLGESEVADTLERLDLSRRLGPGVSLSVHYTARFPEVHVTARLQGEDPTSQLGPLDDAVRRHFADHVIAEDEETLPSRLGAELTRRGWTLATAESCTGGLIGQLITSSAGSSAYFLEGFVTYSNAAKVARLGVATSTLESHGAVSRETAVEMARGVRDRAGTTLGLSVTGIAGPAGGTKEKPVGTVFVCLSTPEGEHSLDLFLPNRSRDRVRELTAYSALALALRYAEGRD